MPLKNKLPRVYGWNSTHNLSERTVIYQCNDSFDFVIETHGHRSCKQKSTVKHMNKRRKRRKYQKY